MGSSRLQSSLLLLLMLIVIGALASNQVSTEGCESRKDCGWNTKCAQGQCQCIESFSFSPNGKDCTNSDLCADSRCIDCYSRHECRRCISFVEESTGRCLDECHQRYRLVVDGSYVGKVCRASPDQPFLSRLYLSVVVGVGLGMTLIVILLLIVCWRMGCGRHKSLEMKVLEKKEEKERQRKEKQFISQFVHENPIYESTRYEHRRMNRAHFHHQREQLQPEMETFLLMLREAKRKLRLMSPDDSAAETFRNIIPQLCRVISLLNDYDAEMPADGNLLLQWAARILNNYLQTHKKSSDDLTLGTLTSTFKPDHHLVQEHLAAEDRNSGSTIFRYERFLELETSEMTEMHSIKLSDGNLTDPIEV